MSGRRRESIVEFVKSDRLHVLTKDSPIDFIRGIGEKGRRELERDGIYTIDQMAKASRMTRIKCKVIADKQFVIAQKIVRSLRLEKQQFTSEKVRRLSNQMTDTGASSTSLFFENDIPDTISLVGRIGVGSFASVYEGIHCAEGKRTKVAIKCFDLRRVLKSELDQICRGILTEAKLQQKLRHERIVRLYDIVDASPRHVSFILEMCHGGDLLSRVRGVRALVFEFSSSIECVTVIDRHDTHLYHKKISRKQRSNAHSNITKT